MSFVELGVSTGGGTKIGLSERPSIHMIARNARTAKIIATIAAPAIALLEASVALGIAGGVTVGMAVGMAVVFTIGTKKVLTSSDDHNTELTPLKPSI